MRFKWENIVLLTVALTPTVLVLSLVNALIPYEEVPRVDTLASGGTIYVIQSLRCAILWPLGILTFFATLTIAASVVVVRRHSAMRGIQGMRDVYFNGNSAGALVMLPFLLLLVLLVVVGPYRHFRKVTVERERVTFAGLYRSWSIPLSDVASVEYLREKHIARGERQVVVSMVVATKAEKTEFKSAPVQHKLGDPELKRYDAVFGRLTNDLQRQEQRAAK